MDINNFGDYFRTIFYNSGTAGIIYEGKKVIMANFGCKELFGYEIEEIIDKNLNDLIFTEDFEIFEKCCDFGIYSNESSQNGEIRIINSDNQIINVLIQVSPIPNTSQCYISFLDINDQILMKKALSRSQGNFNAITESAIDGIITADKNGNIVYSNPSFREIYGYSEEEIRGQNVSILMPERFREDFSSKMNHFQQTGEHFLVGKIFESKGLKKNGEEFPFEMSITYWKSGDDKFLTSIVRDISERKEVEKSLKDSEERLKDLFDNATDLIQMVKPDGSFLYVNKSWKESLGYLNEEIEKLSVFDIIHPDHMKQCQIVFEKVMSGERVNEIETGFITKNRDEIILEGNINAKKDDDGNILYSRAIFRDITEKKQSEVEIKRLANIVESSGEAIIVYNLEGKILDWNPAAEKIYGYSANEVKGRKISMLMEAEKYEENLRNIKKIENGKDVVHFQTTRLRKDGQNRDVSISLSPVKNIDGEIIAISAIARDITEAKRAEENLKASEEKYRRIVEKFVQNALSLIGEINKTK